MDNKNNHSVSYSDDTVLAQRSDLIVITTIFLAIASVFFIVYFATDLMKEKVNYSAIFFALICMGAGFVNLLMMSSTPKIAVRDGGDYLICYTSGKKEYKLTAEDIESLSNRNFRWYTSGTLKIRTKDKGEFCYYYISKVDETRQKIEAWKTEKLQAKIAENKLQKPDGGYDYSNVPDGEDNKNI